jgi:hypothetical protein
MFVTLNETVLSQKEKNLMLFEVIMVGSVLASFFQ